MAVKAATHLSFSLSLLQAPPYCCCCCFCPSCPQQQQVVACHPHPRRQSTAITARSAQEKQRWAVSSAAPPSPVATRSTFTRVVPEAGR